MKKLLALLTVSCLAVPSVFALNIHSVENAVLRAEATQQTKMPVPTAQQRQKFNALLEDAAYVMRNNDLGYLDPAELGEALASSITRFWEMEKEEYYPNEELTNEERRAVYYALYTWLPANYRKDLMTFEEYSVAYPVQDWNAFRQASEQALRKVYRAVEAIARQETNYQYTWLRTLTH